VEAAGKKRLYFGASAAELYVKSQMILFRSLCEKGFLIDTKEMKAGFIIRSEIRLRV